jgi:hypothetical protein
MNDLQRALWRLDNFVELKKLEGFKAKSIFAIKIILITPFMYMDVILKWIVLAFILWFLSLIIRVMLKYLAS